MRIFVDTGQLAEIKEWANHPWVSGFTTNPTLMRQNDEIRLDENAKRWAENVVEAASGKPISIDGPHEVLNLGNNVYRKVIAGNGPWNVFARHNLTAICSVDQLRRIEVKGPNASRAIISVFAGRIMDTGRDPQPVIDAAKATGAQVLWASVREPYNIVQAEQAGCDVVTVPPAILRKWLDWHGKPLEVVAAETIAQFDKDREGLW